MYQDDKALAYIQGTGQEEPYYFTVIFIKVEKVHSK